MSSTYANNETAALFKSLIESITWGLDNDEEQLLVMYRIRDLLVKAKPRTPIMDWGAYHLETGERTITTASEKLEQVDRRIRRFESQGVSVGQLKVG